ncbi:uncharacterized protein METZ01_LOCUS337669, partial [marine metagenome]
MSKKNRITIIVPAHNEEDNLPTFLEETKKVINGLEDYIWKFIFIDDGSEDSTWAVISEMSIVHKNIRGLRLSRNFGKELALTAGILESTEGLDAVILMDADLQHPPSAIIQMIKQWKQGFQVVTAQRKSIKYSILRKIG